MFDAQKQFTRIVNRVIVVSINCVRLVCMAIIFVLAIIIIAVIHIDKIISVADSGSIAVQGVTILYEVC